MSAFFLGCFVGVMGTIFVIGLCMAAKRGDDARMH